MSGEEGQIGDSSDVTDLGKEDKEKIAEEERASSSEKKEEKALCSASVKKVEEKKCRKDLFVEYASSNRSTCRSCNDKITRGTIRIDKNQEVVVGVERDIISNISHWHHVDCIMPYLCQEGVAPEQISNFSNIGIDAKRVLQESYKAFAERSERKRRKSPEIESPSKKKPLMSTEELAALKAQSLLLWTYQDDLKIRLKPDEVFELLEVNHQSVIRGDNIYRVEIPILDIVADGMAFGALSPCPTCGGQLTVYSHSYKCNGDLSDGSTCTYSTNDPARSKWIVPKELKRHRFLKSYKFKPGKRIFPKDGGPSTSIYPPMPKPYPAVPLLQPLFGEVSLLPESGTPNIGIPPSQSSLKPLD